jgi:hypothetical protein
MLRNQTSTQRKGSTHKVKETILVLDYVKMEQTRDLEKKKKKAFLCFLCEREREKDELYTTRNPLNQRSNSVKL